MCLILSGCVSTDFHDSIQSITIKKTAGTTLELGNNKNVISGRLLVKRSFSSLKGRITKEGFKDKEINIKSHFTDDKWAKYRCIGMGCEWEPVTAFELFPLAGTLTYTTFGAIEGARFPVALNGWKGAFLAPFTSVVGAVTGFTVGVANDVRNLFTLSFPRAVFGNPWYEYDKEIDLTREILTPTPEFEKECYSKKNTFIGNNDCLTCLTEREVISTEEECNRCSNRKWSNFECRLK